MLRRISMYGWATSERVNASPNHLYFESCCRALLDALGPRFVLSGSDLAGDVDPVRSLRTRMHRAPFRGPARPTIQVFESAEGVRESWLLQHPPSRLEVPLPRAQGIRFLAAPAIRPDAVDCPTDGATFAISALGPRGERELFRSELDPVRRPEDRVPRPFELDLAALAPDATGLALETGPGAAGNVRCDWAGWVGARFELARPSPLRQIAGGPNPIFENLEAQPRAWIVHEIERREPGDLAGVKAAIVAEGFAPKRAAVVESAQPIASAPPAAPESARVRSRSAERMEIELAVSAPGLLVVADAFYPGWRAEVDGVERPIVPANLALRGVAVAPGDREVVFRYRPRSFATGAAVSAAALTAGAAWLLVALAGRRLRAPGGP
jgi:hypothetical protein